MNPFEKAMVVLLLMTLCMAFGVIYHLKHPVKKAPFWMVICGVPLLVFLWGIAIVFWLIKFIYK